MKTITFSLVALIFVVCSNLNPKKTMSSTSPKISIHSFTVQDINGQTYDFATLKGKKILVVNTASKCGLTPQYEDLETLYKTYKDKNFIIVGF